MRPVLLFLVFAFFSPSVHAQPPKKILFIGNSFTAANDLRDIVRQFFDISGMPAITEAYAPGGISVGDIAMGTAAHMNNPAVFDLIRKTDWDYLVLQDNQGRFALDSGIFPSVSKVIEGHLKIRDSFHHYHSCGKMLWFSGWGFEDEDTMMINSITTNYRVLNERAKDVIAPIGEAWKKSFIERRPLRLWSPDGAHPDRTGSFLTAAVIFGTITQTDVSKNPFSYTLPPPDADFLKNIAQRTLTDAIVSRKSNLNGVQPIDISWDKKILKGAAGKVLYQWYFENRLLISSADATLKPTKSGSYRLWTQDKSGYWQKSCSIVIEAPVVSNISYLENDEKEWSVFPNPASSFLTISNISNKIHSFEIYSVSGQLQKIIRKETAEISIDLSSLASGVYFIKSLDDDKRTINKIQRLIRL